MLQLRWPSLRTYWLGFGALALITLILPRLTSLPIPLAVLLMAVAAGAALAWERRVYLPMLAAGLLVGVAAQVLADKTPAEIAAFSIGLLLISLGFAEVSASLRRSREALLARLRAADALMQAGFDALPDALGLLDAQGTLRLSNDAWRSLAPPGDRPLQAWFAQPATRAAADALFALLAQPSPAPLTLEVTLASGETLAIRGRSFTLDAQPHLLVTVSDLTAQRQAEAAAQRSHHLLESIFLSLSDAVLLLAPGSQQILDCNPAAETIFGYPRAELLGTTIAKLHLDGRAYQQVTGRIAAVLAAEGVFRGVEYLRRADGQMLPLEVTVRPADGADLYLAVFHDLSERHLAEQSLRASEIKFRAFVENQTDGVLLVDASGAVIEWNHASEQILGLPRAEIVDRKVWEVLGRLGSPTWDADGVARLRAMTLETLAQGDHPLLNRPLEISLGDGRVIQQTLFVIDTEVGRMLAASFRDVTEANRQLATLRRQSLIFAHLHDAIVMADGDDFTILDWNPGATELFGYQRAEILGQPVSRLHPTEDAPARVAQIRQVLAHAERWQEILPFTRQDGTTGLAEVVIVPARLPNGQIDLIAGIYHDITERQQRADLLVQQRDFLNTVIEASSEGITVCSEDLRFTFYNSHMRRITGYSWEEAQQPDFLDRLLPDRDGAARQALQAALQGAVFENREWLITRRDGAQRTVLVSTRLLAPYHPRQLLTTLRDLTDRKRLEQVLQDNERKLRLFVENFQGIAYQTQADRLPILFSGRIREITGYGGDDFLSGRLKWREIVHPDDLPAFLQAHFELFAAPQRISSSEYRILQRDGRVVWVQDLSQSLANPEGEVIVQGVVYDVTDRHKMEAELRFLSTHDALTGLYNRAFFEAEVHRRQGGRHFPISFVIADLNNLKITNDTQGHAAGDVLIAQVGDLLRACFRHEDLIARIGGDEFAVILPGADEAVVQGILARIAAQMRPPLSLALGAATAYPGADLHAAIRLADDRMYIEKRSVKRGAEDGT